MTRHKFNDIDRMSGYLAVERDAKTGKFTSERAVAKRQAVEAAARLKDATRKRASRQAAGMSRFETALISAVVSAGAGYLLGHQAGPGQQQQAVSPAPIPQTPQEAFSQMFVSTGSADVPAANEGYFLEISQVQLSVYGGLDDPPMKGDYINLVARTATMGSVEPVLTRPLLTCRGTLVNDPEARVEQWLEMAGPPLTYDGSGWRPVKSLAPNFVTVHAEGPMLFDSNVPVWAAANITTAGVRATASLLYRYTPNLAHPAFAPKPPSVKEKDKPESDTSAWY